MGAGAIGMRGIGADSIGVDGIGVGGAPGEPGSGLRELSSVSIPCCSNRRTRSCLELIFLLTPYNQLWEIFSTFLFLVDDINK
jgi:hypothetical protein